MPPQTLDAQTKYWHLRSFEILAELSDSEVRQLARLAEMLIVGRGQPVYSAGELSDRLFFIKSGSLKLTRPCGGGKEVNVAVLGATDIFGELALTGKRRRHETAKAIEDAVVCSFQRRELERFLLDHPHLALRVAQRIGARLQNIETRARDILFKDVRTRLAHALVRLADRFGEGVGSETRIGMRLTQSELAQLIGSTRETTSTIFNEFRRNGWVDTEDAYIMVKDRQALRDYESR